ncbi:InlB B-repeat-containing protein [Pseudopedobacter saltans]|uniref:InlB B-repeat-containing protein n=1 Tax=Pseudopedobacter saltans TaxID=151895 RepID=UPI00145F29C3|nr:T9SS type A sorting domain-containing protein [Pseudopedobacter saltans]
MATAKKMEAQTNAEMEDIAIDVLDGVSSMGWDPANQGIYINWHRENFQQVNSESGGASDLRDEPTRHDTQNDIRALQHYYWWKWLNNGDTRYDLAIARLLPTVKSKFKTSSSEKGWMYYVFLRLYQYADSQAEKDFWEGVILQWAPKMINKIDPTYGVIYQNGLGNCDCGSKTIYLDKAYRVGHNVQMGAALVDAGTRFNKPDWVTKGYALTMKAYEQAFVESYGLFGRIYLISDDVYGTDKLWDTQAKLGETSETIDALVRAASITGNQQIKTDFNMIATKMLNALRDQPVHDKSIYGGYFSAQYVGVNHDGKTGVSDGNKEMRQGSLLGTFTLANRLIVPNNQWIDLENEMKRIVCRTSTDSKPGMYLRNSPAPDGDYNEYRKTIAGWTFDMNPNWSLAGNIEGGKNWVSNESNSLCLLGIFQYLTEKPDESGKRTYELELNSTEGGTVITNPNLPDYEAGTSVNLTATANPGYVFKSWSGDLTATTNPVTLAVDGFKRITANFEKDGVLIVNLTVYDAPHAAGWSIEDNLQQGDFLYSDRVFTVKTLPAAYAGLQWIKPANDSKGVNADPLLSFKVTKDAEVYIAFINNSAVTKPDWLINNWTNTGDLIVSSNSNASYTVYKKEITANTLINLPPNNNSKDTYFVMAKSLTTTPLTILSFKVVKVAPGYTKGAELTWTTTNEINTDKFLVERSLDGVNFKVIGSVKSNNVSGIQRYSFIDENAPVNTCYYRLQQLDQDGKCTYSRVLAFTNETAYKLSVYPNPAGNQIKISHAETGADAWLRIFNADGKQVKKQRIEKGWFDSECNIEELPAGVYILEFSDKPVAETIRFLKK